MNELFPGYMHLEAPFVKDVILPALSLVDGRIYYYQAGKGNDSGPRFQFFHVAKVPAKALSAADLIPAMAEDKGFFRFVSLDYEAGYTFQKFPSDNEMADRPVAVIQEVSCFYVCDLAACTGAIYYRHRAALGDAEALKSLLAVLQKAPPLNPPPHQTLSLSEVAEIGELTAAKYTRDIASLLDDISDGRFYEVNYTQRFTVKSSAHPREAFARLFSTLRPRHSCYFESDFHTVVGCSPELLLESFDGRMAVTAPIKGSFEHSDRSADHKQLKAEHTMVVDLARNDLGRISKFGTVNPEKLYDVELFGNLSHYVTRINGELVTDDAVAILSAFFPGASITGAPKIESMKAIQELEASQRGAYTGSCGYFFAGGRFSLNVAIRTLRATKQDSGWCYEMGAGGAIIHGADPMAEYRECLLKAQPVLSALVSTTE